MPDDVAPPAVTFQGLRVLIVEDEVAISMLIEDMLIEVGAEVVGPVGRLGQARGFLDRPAFEVAIIDVNVAGEPVYPLAAELAERGIPFAFSTGYGAGGIEPEWRTRPILQKPFSQRDLERVLGELKAA